MVGLGFLAFLNPWMLLALGLLPVIWWLLRITPPSPRGEPFPPVRILKILTKTEETPAATPLWLTILRLVLAAMVILALAQPTLNPRGGLEGTGSVVVIVDDGWKAGANWAARREVLEDIVDRAEREGRAVMIVKTAAPADGSPIATGGLLPANEARRLVRSLVPQPWDVDRKAALAALESVTFENRPNIIWLSDGIEDGFAEAFASRLLSIGDLVAMTEPTANLAKALIPPEVTSAGLKATVLRPAADLPETVNIRLFGEDGRVLARAKASFAAEATRAEATIELPSELRNEGLRLDIDAASSAGSVVLLDERWRRRPIGMISGADSQERAQPLLSNLYFLARAQSPFAEVREGTIGNLLAQPLAIIVLADVGALVPDDVERLGRWIDDGGLLIRFAGPRLAQNVDSLIPVRLRRGGRVLGGALTWSRPAQIAAFAETSPFHGLIAPDDVRVSRQVLAEPSLELDQKTWARLKDGTPLVTADQRGRGWIVLFHTTANTDWSNLPISGLFVEMLRRLAALSRGVVGEESGRMLPALSNLDGEGRLMAPSPLALPIKANQIETTVVEPQHPPGFYGSEDSRRALNLTQGIESLEAITALPQGVASASYASAREFDLKPWLLVTALVLALVDLVAVLMLRGVLNLPLRRSTTTVSILTALLSAGIFVFVTKPVSAQTGTADEVAIEATSETRLAYVITGNEDVDSMSRAGLAGLSEILRTRTSVEADEPMAVDVERDELAFFPLLYWPVTAMQRPISDAAAKRLSDYMKSGGTILFDTRDAQMAVPSFGRMSPTGGAGQRLKQLLRRLDVPPLVPVPQDHVLAKAFYLMQTFPGRYANGRLWVELRPGGVNDGVSSIIIGSNDWAAAWAMDEQARPLAAVIPGGARQRELAYRFGVNLVMYTLTGNYKADQVHVPAILERLGQ